MKLVRKLLAVAMLLPSIAGAQILNQGWTEFVFATAPSAVTPSYTVNTLNAFLLRITDGYKVGDQFKLDWTGTSAGSLFTSNFTGADGFATGCTTGAACWPIGGLSKASQTFGAGNYTFTLNVTRNALGSPNGGSGFIDVATVPEPSTYALMGAGLLAVLGFAKRRRA